ncbi:uncharacterized protein LOC106711174 [Papilio machaon]|uniref:uncharacterized protein LOC106711174 n=1 Tax=Papilio machaon TaxID=76193 RepID=UPI001E663D15|nr:uncharacterized protein LOC106711174 [Papilio machaon]
MRITDLPVEIVVIIIKKLDIKSVHNLYESCSHFKNLICMYNVVKTANLALSTTATVHFLKETFMKDISPHLQTLDLRGVGDLSRTALQTAVRGMKCLNTIDVSYTNINLFDIYEVHKLCPTIKNVACNFVFGTKKDIKAKNIQWQDLFQNFDKVHFVGNAANLLFSSLVAWMLHKACLSKLQLTIVENCGIVYDPVEEANETNVKIHSKFISICILNVWKIPIFSGTTLTLPSLQHLEEIYECVVVITEDLNQNQVYVSPMFMKVFKSYNAKCIKVLDVCKHVTNAVIMLWDKSKTVFDDMFFKVLKSKMINLLPHHIADNITVVPPEYDNCFLSVPLCDMRASSKNTVTFKKQRLAPQCPILNYDTVFQQHKTIHLTMFFPSNTNIPVTLSPSSQYLRKLRSLYLTGSVLYSKSFFYVLFSCCQQLETLNVEDSPWCPNQLGHIALSRLKNLRLVNRQSNFKAMFSSLSECSTLENIHILDSHMQECNNLADPSALFEKCHNLYCISICVNISDSAIARANQLYKKLKAKYGKWHMHIALSSNFSQVNHNYDPYCHVFNLYPVKPLEQLY